MAENKQLTELQAAIAKIEKTYGEGTIINLGNQKMKEVAHISTGSLRLNKLLGINGFPKGRVIEIFGPESSGKTTLAIHSMIEAQKQGGIVAIIDAEHAFDLEYAKNLGFDPSKAFISQPDYGEQALEIVDTLVTSKQVSMILIDSVAALVPKSELEGEMGDSKMGVHARLMSQALRKLTAKINNSNCIVIFINQLREKIATMSWGTNETTTGGNALKFYASIRLDIRRIGPVRNKEGEEPIGNKTRIKIVKNKLGIPGISTEVELIFGRGLCPIREVLNLAVELDIIKQAGSWFSYEGNKIGQGKSTVYTLLIENKILFNEIYDKIISNKLK